MAELWLREARALLATVGRSTESADGRAWALEHASGVLTAATDLRDQMDRLLGCACRDERPGLPTHRVASLVPDRTVALWRFCAVVEECIGLAYLIETMPERPEGV